MVFIKKGTSYHKGRIQSDELIVTEKIVVRVSKSVIYLMDIERYTTLFYVPTDLINKFNIFLCV